MKDIKCPLCKEKLEQFNVLRDGTLVEVGCHKCKWSTHPNSPEEAWKEVEELISLFPPIMQLRQGDNVLVWLSDDIHTVLGTDLASGKIHLQDVYGDADSYDPAGIKKWPWELERKGGTEQ